MKAIHMLATAPWVGRLGWALIHFLWQGGLIASLYAIARIVIVRPRIRYFLACAALLAMIVATVTTFVRNASSGSIPDHAAHFRAESSTRSEWSTTPMVSADPGDSFRLDNAMPWFVTAWFAGQLCCGYVSPPNASSLHECDRHRSQWRGRSGSEPSRSSARGFASADL